MDVINRRSEHCMDVIKRVRQSMDVIKRVRVWM